MFWLISSFFKRKPNDSGSIPGFYPFSVSYLYFFKAIKLKYDLNATREKFSKKISKKYTHRF